MIRGSRERFFHGFCCIENFEEFPIQQEKW